MRSLLSLLLLFTLVVGCARKSGTEGTTDTVSTRDSGMRRPGLPTVADRIDPPIRVDAPEPAIPIEGDSITFTGSVKRGEHGVRYKMMLGRNTLLEGTVPATEPVPGDTSGRLHFATKLPRPKTDGATAGQQQPGRPMPLLLMVTLDGGDTGRGAPRVMIPLATSDTGAHTKVFNLYFRNPSMGDPKACDAVQPVKRLGPDRLQPRLMLALLVRGPSPDEQRNGYRTELPPGAIAKNYKEENGTALVDFNAEMNRVTDQCSRTAARIEIEKTLMQVPGITSVKITVEGQPF